MWVAAMMGVGFGNSDGDGCGVWVRFGCDF